MTEMEPVFVDEVPWDLEDGRLYISVRYATAAHLCPCGCRSEVVTAFHPARFSLTFDGATISLFPSIGNGNLSCRSHYFITKNRIRWCAPLSDRKVAEARYRDLRALERWEGADEDAATGEGGTRDQPRAWWRPRKR